MTVGVLIKPARKKLAEQQAQLTTNLLSEQKLLNSLPWLRNCCDLPNIKNRCDPEAG